MSTWFDVIQGLGSISVKIDGDFATFFVHNIEDVEIIVRAIAQARAAGAIRGVMFTGEVVASEISQKDIVRAQKGTTWLGGKVARLPDSPSGNPLFRIDWDQLPALTH